MCHLIFFLHILIRPSKACFYLVLTDNMSVRRGLNDNLPVRSHFTDNLSGRRGLTDNLSVRSLN